MAPKYIADFFSIDEPSMLSLNTEDADHSELVDGDMNTCHYATSAGLDGGLFINVDDGTAYIHYVDIFLPTTASEYRPTPSRAEEFPQK